MGDNETAYVMCVRVDTPNMYITPGSIIGRCDRCQAKVWVSQSTFAMTIGMQLELVCPPCLQPEEMVEIAKAVLKGPAFEQETEIQEWVDGQDA